MKPLALLSIVIGVLFTHVSAQALEHVCTWKHHPGSMDFARDVHYKITEVKVTGVILHHMSVAYVDPDSGRVLFKQEGIATVRQHGGGHTRYVLGKEQIGLDSDGWIRCYRN